MDNEKIICCGVDIELTMKRLESEKKDVEKKMYMLANLFKNKQDLANKSSNFHNYRQTLIGKKSQIISEFNIFNLKFKEVKKNVTDAYKFGRKIDKPTNSKILPKNEEERETYYGYDMKQELFLKSLYDVHIEFLTESLDNVKGMVYGVEPILRHSTKYTD